MVFFQNVFENLNADLENVFHNTLHLATSRNFPPTDVSEADTHYELKSDVAGFSKSDIKITQNGQCLTISGQREQPDMMSGVVERYFGKFARTICLPSSADLNETDASVKNGLLVIKIHKTSTLETTSIVIK